MNNQEKSRLLKKLDVISKIEAIIIFVLILSLVAITILLLMFFGVIPQSSENNEVVNNSLTPETVLFIWLLVSPLILIPIIVLLNKSRKLYLKEYIAKYPEDFENFSRFRKWINKL